MHNREMQIEKCKLKNAKFSRFLKSLICIVTGSFLLTWGSFAYAQSGLKIKEPALCYQCHEKTKEGLSERYLHFLFKRGKCTTCHNSHVSNIEGLMKDEIDSICLGCHEDIRNLLRSVNLHSALRYNVCTDCHNAHSGKHKHLIVKAEKNLCLDCHETLKEETMKPYTCLPFKQGKCSSCHNSHASSEDALLLSPPNKICKKCHAPRCTAGIISISPVTKKLDCTSCHTGHGTKDKGLLGPYGHSAFLDKNCNECHNPIVDSKNITIKIEGKNLCFGCHSRGDTRDKYIDNDIHVKDVENPCIVCHDYHASAKKNLTINETRLCIPCHQDTEKRTIIMEKTLKNIKCPPVRDRKCFACHMRDCSSQMPLYFSGDETFMCVNCHEAEHKITHPLGTNAIDPRNGQPMTCNSCHSIHTAREDFMLSFDKDRELCIQCHKM